MIQQIMSLATAPIPTNNAALQAFAAHLQTEYARLQIAYAQLETGNKVLLSEVHNKTLWIEKIQAELDELKRYRYGRRSEKIEQRIEQLEMALDDLYIDQALDRIEEEKKEQQKKQEAPPATPKKKRKTSEARKSLPEHLPRERHQHDAACMCPACGGKNLTLISTEEREVLDYVPAHFRVIVHVMPKMGCRDCEKITQPVPALPIERGLPSANLLAHVLTAKYCDHLPLYRQSEIYAREGVKLDRATMAEWIGRMADLVDPLADAVRRHIALGESLHADDTPIRVLDPGRGRTKTGRLWVVVRDERPWGSSAPPAAFYRYAEDRKAQHATALLEGCGGFLHADAYAGFNQLYKLHPRHQAQFMEVACWAHARRKIYEVWVKDRSPAAEALLKMIAELFAIEADIRGSSPEQRLKVRAEKSAPMLTKMKTAFEAALTRTSQQGKLAKALRYAINLWPALTLYTTDGRCDISNNAAERAIRPLALGRKNWLFAGSDKGGISAAAIFTLTQTAKLNGVNVEAYLRHVLNVIADHPIKHIDQLLPWNVKL